MGINLSDDLTENQIAKLIQKEKFKRNLKEIDVSIDEDLVDSLSASNVDLTPSLVKNLAIAKNSGGDPQVLAEQVLANKSSGSSISKVRSIPDQIAFDAIVGPFLDVLDVILDTHPTEIKLDFKRFDELSVKLESVNKHLSKNPFQKTNY